MDAINTMELMRINGVVDMACVCVCFVDRSGPILCCLLERNVSSDNDKETDKCKDGESSEMLDERDNTRDVVWFGAVWQDVGWDDRLDASASVGGCFVGPTKNFVVDDWGGKSNPDVRAFSLCDVLHRKNLNSIESIQFRPKCSTFR